MNIHFICHGNVLRSFIAEAYVKSLQLPNITVTSSGTNVDDNDTSTQVEFRTRTTALLSTHGIGQFAKQTSDQLTQMRTDNQDVTVCMNQLVYDDAINQVTLPANVQTWAITDIGEGNRILIDGNRSPFEEIIYQEIIDKVNQLVIELSL